MKIYIMSSFKNIHGVQMLRDLLVSRGHTVLDWTTLPPPIPKEATPEARRALLASDASGEIARFCAEACAHADLCVLYLPAGKDAATESGIAFGSGTPLAVLESPYDAPGLMENHVVTARFTDYRDLLRYVTEQESKTA